MLIVEIILPMRKAGMIMNSELVRMQEEVIMAYFKVLSQNFLGVTKVNHGEPQ
jgi:hypothetical protein